MTETMPEQTEDWSDVENSADGASYPEHPSNPHNHVYTVSMDGRGPMIVVRGNTPAEVTERFQALMDGGVTTVAASVYSHMKAEMAVAQGVGPVSPVAAPAGPPAPPAFPQGPPAPGGVPGTAPAAWQNAGAPTPPPAPAAPAGPSNAEYAQAGWYRLDVPFPKKGQFDGICAQYQMKKGRPSEGGSYSFNSKGEKAWYVHPQYAGAFPMFSPVPA